MLFMPLTVHAEAEFGNILNDKIREYGVFDGENGVVYSSQQSFYYGQDMLLICYVNNNVLYSSVYGINDGAECIDTLSIEILPRENAVFSVINYDNMAYLMLRRSSKDVEYFSILDDRFTHVPAVTYSDKHDIAMLINGRVDTLTNNDLALYNFLNEFRRETIESYPYMNKAKVLSGEARSNMIKFLTACAGLTEFDRENYSYDRLFKYVLYTHEAFTDIVGINPHSSLNSDIKSVSGEFIDYIMLEILGVTPEHPAATALTDRGFCYKDGMYLFTGGFSAEYSTEILDIVAVHELGAGNYHVVFSDIYREGESVVPEYSYAVINNRGDMFSLLRLGMGANLLTAKQISRYAAVTGLATPAWEKETPQVTGNTARGIYVIVIAIGAAIAAAILVAAVLLWRKR